MATETDGKLTAEEIEELNRLFEGQNVQLVGICERGLILKFPSGHRLAISGALYMSIYDSK